MYVYIYIYTNTHIHIYTDSTHASFRPPTGALRAPSQVPFRWPPALWPPLSLRSPALWHLQEL